MRVCTATAGEVYIYIYISGTCMRLVPLDAQFRLLLPVSSLMCSHIIAYTDC